VSSDVVVTALMFPVALFLCRCWSVRPNWNLGEYVRSVAAIGWVASLVVLLYGGFRYAADRVLRRNNRALRRDRGDGWRSAGTIATSLGLLLASSWTYSHVKVGVLCRESVDDWLRRIDRTIFLGCDSWQVARAVVPSAAGSVLHVVYMLFLPVVMAGVFWLSLQREIDRARKLTMCVILGYHIGVLAYFVFPSYGPTFLYETARCDLVSPSASRIQALLLSATQEMHSQRERATVHAWRYIAAFPSLHFSHVLMLCWYLRKDRWDLGCSVGFSVLTAISTVYLGWHYAVDLLGGVGIAAVCITIVERFPYVTVTQA
jgi:hypothetical protein